MRPEEEATRRTMFRAERSYGRFLDALEPRLLLGGDPFPDIALMEDPTNPVVQMSTDRGNIFIELLANEVPETVNAYLSSVVDSRFATNQTFFSDVQPGVSLTGGTWYFFDDEGDGFHDTNTLNQLGVNIRAAGETGRANTERTISTRIVGATPIPGSGRPENLVFNLTDNSATRDADEFFVFARVIDDASWSVVLDIASLPPGSFGAAPNVYPGVAIYLPSVPLAMPYVLGEDATPELVVHAFDTQVVKALDAPDYYRHAIYSAEGFTGATINEFVPIENPNDEPVYVEVRTRYERLPHNIGQLRDGVVHRAVIPANSRGGFTISTPDDWDEVDVFHGVPYALEILSSLPVAANFSHYDFGIATGEAFVGTLDTTWFIGNIEKSTTSRDFILWHNPLAESGTLTLTFISDNGDTLDPIVMEAERLRRGGMNIRETAGIPDGNYSLRIESTVPILASHTHYADTGVAPDIDGYATIGQAGAPSTVGVAPIAYEAGGERNSTRPVLTFVFHNPDTVTADISIDFFAPGATVPALTLTDVATLAPGARQRVELEAADLPDLPSLIAVYRSSVGVHASYSFLRIEDSYAAPVGIFGATDYHFAEGFSDPSRPSANALEESLTIFNPFGSVFGLQPQTANVLITVRYTDGFSFTRNLTIDGGTGDNLHISSLAEIIDNALDHDRFFYSIEVSSDLPIIAQFMHTDDELGSGFQAGGGFTSLGTSFSGQDRIEDLINPV